MLFPFTHAWTRRQKALIVGSGLLALTLSAALIYGYERYYRGPGEEVLYGTWQGEGCIDCTQDLTLYPDHTFISSGESLGQYTIYDTGTWYADFNTIFLRRRNADEGALVLMKLSDVTEKELKIARNDRVETWTRGKTLTREQIQSMVGKTDFTYPP
jgi:hypothetical protein